MGWSVGRGDSEVQAGGPWAQRLAGLGSAGCHRPGPGRTRPLVATVLSGAASRMALSGLGGPCQKPSDKHTLNGHSQTGFKVLGAQNTRTDRWTETEDRIEAEGVAGPPPCLLGPLGIGIWEPGAPVPPSSGLSLSSELPAAGAGVLSCPMATGPAALTPVVESPARRSGGGSAKAPSSRRAGVLAAPAMPAGTSRGQCGSRKGPARAVAGSSHVLALAV